MMMWIDPTGKMWGMDQLLEMMRAKMPWPDIFFRNLVPSGFALLIVNGLTQIIAFYLLKKKHSLASYAVIACGIILMLWISLEWWLFGFSWLPNAYFAFGALEAISAVCSLKANKG